MGGRLWYGKHQQPQQQQQQNYQQQQQQSQYQLQEQPDKPRQKHYQHPEELNLQQSQSHRKVEDFTPEVFSSSFVPNSTETCVSCQLNPSCVGNQKQKRQSKQQREKNSDEHSNLSLDQSAKRKNIFTHQRRFDEKWFKNHTSSHDSKLKHNKSKLYHKKIFSGRSLHKSSPKRTKKILRCKVDNSSGASSLREEGPYCCSKLVTDLVIRPDSSTQVVDCYQISNNLKASNSFIDRSDVPTAYSSDHTSLDCLGSLALHYSLQKVVYAADCVSGCQGTGMASRSFHSLPSTTTITTTTTTTTSNTTRGQPVCIAASTSDQQQQQQSHRHQQARQEYHYPRNHHQVHQPHHINPANQHQYQHSTQQVKLQQQCSSSSSPACAVPSIASLNQYYPARIALPDGEERPYILAVGRHNKDKVSEQKRSYIKPPANKTLFDLQHCKPRLSPPLSGFGDSLSCSQSSMLLYQHPSTSSHPLQAAAAPPHSPTLPHPPLSPPPAPTAPSPSSRQHTHKHQHREKDNRSSNISPQPARKPKNLLANYMANLTSSPKNRKESSSRKVSQQNTGNNSSCSGSCSSNINSCNNNANICCNSTNNKLTLGKTVCRERDRVSYFVSGIPPALSGNAESLRRYSTLSSSLPSPEIPVKDPSLEDSPRTSPGLTDSAADGISTSLPCPSGPNSVAEVTLLPCYPSTLTQSPVTKLRSYSSCLSQQQDTIHYQTQHYQQPQYLQPHYQHHDRPISPLPSIASPASPPLYHQLPYDHQHNPLTSSVSSSPPLSPSSSSPLRPSSPVSRILQYEYDVENSEAHSLALLERGEMESLRAEDDQCLLDQQQNIQQSGPCDTQYLQGHHLQSRLGDTLCSHDQLHQTQQHEDSRACSARQARATQQQHEDSVNCRQRSTCPQQVRSYSRPVSLISDKDTTQSHLPPNYREVLEHPDRYRIPTVNKRNSVSTASVLCDNDSLQSTNEPQLIQSEATSKTVASSLAVQQASISQEISFDIKQNTDEGEQTHHQTDFVEQLQDSQQHQQSSQDEQQQLHASLQEDEQQQQQFPQEQQQQSSSSSMTVLYGPCYEKEVI